MLTLNPSMFIARLLRDTKMFHTGSPSFFPHCNLCSFQLGYGENLKANMLFLSNLLSSGYLGVGKWEESPSN